MALYKPRLDHVIFQAIHKAEETIENKLDCDLLCYSGEIRIEYLNQFRDKVETLAARDEKREALGVCLTTPGGQAEAVEKMVEIIRHHYQYLYVIVPQMALSAGTIFCMAADKIYMDYASSLGPIDPQVPDKEGRFFIPALGYLDKINELIDKSRNGTITPAEFTLLEKQDLAMLRFYEQAKDLSVNLLKSWLTKYKFKDWSTHRTHNKGKPVRDEEKVKRAEEVAEILSDNNHWHSHGRMIGMKTMREEVRIEIDDFGLDDELQDAIRCYCDTLTDYLARHQIPWYISNRNTE